MYALLKNIRFCFIVEIIKKKPIGINLLSGSFYVCLVEQHVAYTAHKISYKLVFNQIRIYC